MRNKRFRKKSGFILLPVILAMFIVGLLGVGLASMYSGTFSTLQAGQAASQAKQYASIEAVAIKARGYDDAESGAHDWQDMTSLVGSEDGSKWQSKVETMRTDTTPDGNNVKVMKVSTRKNGELVSRYSEEIPVVEGLDVYNKDEIDSMFSTVNHQIGTLTTDLTNLTTRMTSAESSITNLSGDINTINSNIDSINADLDTLQKMINANTSLINDETSYRKTADTNLQNNINEEANAQTSAVNAINLQINSLKSTLSNLQGALTSEANARKASDSTLQSNINSEASARAKAIQDLAAEVNNKYTELKNLYDGIKGRLDGKEFVRSKDSANNISLKYEQLAGEDKKSIHAYVDGNLVPLSSQNNPPENSNGSIVFGTPYMQQNNWNLVSSSGDADGKESFVTALSYSVSYCIPVQIMYDGTAIKFTDIVVEAATISNSSSSFVLPRGSVRLRYMQSWIKSHNSEIISSAKGEMKHWTDNYAPLSVF